MVASTAGAVEQALRRPGQQCRLGRRPGHQRLAIDSGGCGLQGHQVVGDGAHIGLVHLGQGLHHSGHAAPGDAVLGVVALAQVVQHRGFSPGHGAAAGSTQRRGLPAIDQGAAQVRTAGLLGAQRVARRVAGAAVAQAVDERGTPVPLG